MLNWTREEKYTKLSDVSKEDYDHLVEKVKNSKWRQTYHIQPKTGLLNDPNGLIYHDGKYHIFHQWFPLGAVHGIKYWYHYTSEDLLRFDDLGIALGPDTPYDSHGVYSGSAFDYDGKLHLMYTGNVRDSNWTRTSNQLIAVQQEDGSFEKSDAPIIIGSPAGYTEHFRDPKVWKENDTYYAIFGIQRDNETGTAIIYESKNIKDWNLKGELKTNLNQFGYMWECPDLFKLNEKDVFVFSTQGIAEQESKFQNIYQSGYIIGQLDLDELTMNHDDFKELDQGFDFYAPQTFLDKNGNRLLIGWMGLPETEYATDNEGWAHCLTIPRELTIEDGKLKQRPLKALEQLRTNKETAEGYANKHSVKLHPYEGKQFELIIDILENDASEIYFDVRVSKKCATHIIYNTETKQLTLDRYESGIISELNQKQTRETILEEELKQLRIFSDTSSLEIFVNDGECVFSSRIFPDENAVNFKTSTESGQVYLKFTKYSITTGIEEL
ncbi:sucrose-6-phosphate hydrolase [Mammaliicoccus stepanovicii]|uniref:Sucrose-6-phosphate hydrolase n=1 Tax=Mammaliicoccus stepanovicii TaxID=643214 RepID=A0A239YR47_9STAP|nr:sucrose-6-phosphate hydrolase [Mammaliicoccus stepanovicii]PNZ74794.1 sucrose-6-phosphate hydrolase [Mammaliicoccus stepanovicii]GGI42457.1 invertase [Mammaliicoccus stepanovicii]SNV61003.1 sucrose-6-phosphate hydrolase [Mammaliicoccus stepanovicii]